MKVWIVPLLTTLLAACGGGGDSGSSSGVGLPLAPSNLNTKVDNSGVTVGWLSVLGADSYNLYYSTDPAFTVSNYAVYANSGLKVGAVSPLKITGLGNGPVYYFRATTVDGGKEGSPTGIIHAVTRYEITGANDEYVKDKITGLEWQRCSLGQVWNKVAASCDGVANKFTTAQTIPMFAADADGWRVPTLEEMRSIQFCAGERPAFFVAGKNSCQSMGQVSVMEPEVVQDVYPQTQTSRPYQTSTTMLSSGMTVYCSSAGVCSGDATGTQRLPNYIRMVRTVVGP